MIETERIARAYERIDAAAGGRWDLANPGNRLILNERRRIVRRLLDEAGWIPFGSRSALEVGCGRGSELAWLLEVGAEPSRLIGLDLLPERVVRARQAHPGLRFEVGNAARIDFSDSSFDLVMAITLFSSILDGPTAETAAAEIERVLRPGGALLWYDFRYPSPANPDVRGVGSNRVRRLFGGLEGELRTVTLLPPLARRLGPVSGPAYAALAALPPLRSHLVGLLRKE
jgi:ubiquinone/menaquinone biosynthesis C-methylase UbiE